MNRTIAILLAFHFLLLGRSFAETQNTLSVSAPELFPGDSGTFTASSVSGPTASATGTKTFTYTGLVKYGLNYGDGRYTGNAGISRYGTAFDVFEVFQSFISPLFHTTITSGGSCPSTTTYHWVGTRFRNHNLARGAQNPQATNFYAAGTLTYDSIAPHPLTGSNYINLVGPTANSASYSLDANGASCASGTFKTLSNAAGLWPTPFDDYGSIRFGTYAFMYIGSGGNPVMIVGLADQTVDSTTFSGINQHVFSGIYTSFDAAGSQTRNKVMLVPDSAGTTFTLRNSTSDTDPTQYTSLGTLACTNVGSPSAGFCSGTLTLQGSGNTGNAVCAVSTLGSPILACAAQNPMDTKIPVSILASVPTRSILSVSVSPTVAQLTAEGTSTTITATLTNLSGRAIPSLANPGSGLDLTSPFSNTGAYAGADGTCGSTLAGFATCNVDITYAPGSQGAHAQTFRVAYNNGSSTVNATATVTGTRGLSSVAIDQDRPGYAPNSSSVLTATGTFANGTTQDVSNLVTWSSSNTSAATVTSAGTAAFFQAGSATISAALGSSSGALSTHVVDPATYFTVLGQTDTETLNQAGAGSTQDPQGVAAIVGKVFVADTGDSRIMAWNSNPATNGPAPSFTLCQTDPSQIRVNQGGISASRCFNPARVSTDGTRLAVSDGYNSRVLLWNALPTAQGQPANIVLGQPNFSTRSNALTQTGFGTWLPGVFVGSSKVIVADYYYNRVLIWNSIPTVNQQPADLVLGQSGFTTSNGGDTSTELWRPGAAYTDGTKLYVADTGNHRVLIWNAFPTANGQAASAVLGQTGFGASNCNKGSSATSTSLCEPFDVYISGTNLYVADRSNNRVLVWNSLPSTTGLAADLVIGAANFTTSSGSSNANNLRYPSQVAVAGSNLYIADPGNHRVQIFNPVPTSNGATAAYTLGQAATDEWFPGSGRVQTMNSARIGLVAGISSNGTNFAVGDWAMRHVLLWNSFPTGANQAADVVVGQPNFTSRNYNTSQTGMGVVLDVAVTGKKLLVVDSNNRVLIWNSLPTANGQAASIVLGQPSFTTSASNTTSTGLVGPIGVFSDGIKIAVADYDGNRVLIWNSFPTTNGQAANLVLGQTSFTTSGYGTTSSTFDAPLKAVFSDTKFAVLDEGNKRILVWNSFPTANGQAASYVLGAPDFTTVGGGNDTRSFLTPNTIFTDGTRLMLGCTNRLVTWNSWPTMNYQPFDSYLGQLADNEVYDNIGSTGTYTNPTGLLLSRPSAIYSDGIYTFFGDNNARVVAVPPASSVYASLTISGGPTYAYGTGTVTNTYNATFTVSNTGSQTANGIATGSTALSAPFYYKGGAYPGTGGTCGTSLAGSASCTVVVSFLPTAAGSFSGTLQLSYMNGNGGAPVNTTGVTLTGTVSMTNLTISDGPTYAFGTVGSATNKTFTITNSGGTRTTAMWSGTPALAAPFSFYGGTFPGTGGTCTTTLAGNSTCTIVVRFNPTSNGSYSDTVRLVYTDASSAGQTLSVDVTGSK